MSQLPTSPHDWALWLFETLEQLKHVGTHWEGFLPGSFDFDETVEHLPQSLKGWCDQSTRLIEFHPEAAEVFETMDGLLLGRWKRAIPERFTVRDLGYTHGTNGNPPPIITDYLNAVRLWGLLDGVADHGRGLGQALFFLKTYESKIELRCEYGASDLCALPNLDEFAKNYFDSDHHKDQKRNIVRDALLECFKGLLVVRMAEVLAKFSDFAERVRRAYTLYTADFSFEKLRSEVDKQNLEDTLRLNKTLSDIQNQLLALPAALLLVGASVKDGNAPVNLSILMGVSVFVWIMRSLIRNQRSSVEAIKGEVTLRTSKIKEQPPDISTKLLVRFEQLHTRIENQTGILNGIMKAVWAVWLVTVAVLLNAQWPSLAGQIHDVVALDGRAAWDQVSDWGRAAHAAFGRVRSMGF